MSRKPAPVTGSAAAPQPSGKGAGNVSKGGPPAKNRNAWKSGAYSGRPVREQRDASRKQAEREVRGILLALGLESDAPSRYVAKQLRRVETMTDRLERILDTRGLRDKTGALKPATREFLELCKQAANECRRLLEIRAAGTGLPTTLEEARALCFRMDERFPGMHVYVATFNDGRPAPTPGLVLPVPLQEPPGEPQPLPDAYAIEAGCNVATGQPRAAPGHPLDRRADPRDLVKAASTRPSPPATPDGVRRWMGELQDWDWT